MGGRIWEWGCVLYNVYFNLYSLYFILYNVSGGVSDWLLGGNASLYTYLSTPLTTRAEILHKWTRRMFQFCVFVVCFKKGLVIG